MPMTRDEHLEWSKVRALKYLNPASEFYSPLEAMTSMMSDLCKHDELKNHAGLRIAPMFYGGHNDPASVKRWILGFN